MTVSSGNNNSKKKEVSFKYNGNNNKGYIYGGINGYKDYYSKYRNYYSYYKVQNNKNNNQYETQQEEKQKKRTQEKNEMKQKEKPKIIEEDEKKKEEEKINKKKKNVIKILKRPNQTKTEETKKGNLGYCKDTKEKERKRDKGNNHTINEMTTYKKAKVDSRERGRKLIENLKFNSSQQLLLLLLRNTKKYHLERKRSELIVETQKKEKVNSKNLEENKEHELDNKNKKDSSKLLHSSNSSLIDSKGKERKGEKVTQENNSKNILGILNKSNNVLYMKKKNEEVQKKEEIDIGRKMGEEILNLINKGYKENSGNDLKKQEKTENRVCFNLESSNKGEDSCKENELKQIKDKSKSSSSSNNGFTIGNIENSTTSNNNSTLIKPTKVLSAISSEKTEVENNVDEKMMRSNTNTSKGGVHSHASLINKALELEGTKSKSLQMNNLMEDRKERNSFFAMPLYMRSPEPEEIPIPIYLSDNEKNKEMGIKILNDEELKEQTDGSKDKSIRNNKSMLFDEMKIKRIESKNDKKSDIEENAEVVSNKEEKTEVTTMNQEENKEKVNHSNRSSVSNGCNIGNNNDNNNNNNNSISNNVGNDINKTNQNVKHVEESYVNKNHFTGSKKKYVDNGPKKIISNKNYNSVNTEPNRKTSGEYMSHKGFKKNYKTFYYTSQYFGSTHNLNGIYPKSRRSFKVDKCYSRKYKTRPNLEDNNKNKHLSFLNDMKIAVY